MPAKVRLGVSDATYLRPLLFGLNAEDSPFELSFDYPAVNSVHLNERTKGLRCAFLSPIDYARHGGLYRIVPQVCVSSTQATGAVTLTVKRDVRNIRKVAVDVRVTSEIVLAKIVLLERFRNVPEERSEIQFIPMMPSLETMLQKADAALLVNLSAAKSPVTEHHTLDLVEEWSDLTGLPYVHGFWVAREEDFGEDYVRSLIDARDRGVSHMDAVVSNSAQSNVPQEQLATYFESFSYDFGQDEIDAVEEFMKFAYYHGVLGDVPELSFFDHFASS